MAEQQNTMRERERKFAQPMSVDYNIEAVQIGERIVFRWVLDVKSANFGVGLLFYIAVIIGSGLYATQKPLNDPSRWAALVISAVSFVTFIFYCFNHKKWDEECIKNLELFAVDLSCNEIQVYRKPKTLDINKISGFYNWAEYNDGLHLVRAMYEGKPVTLLEIFSHESTTHVVRELGLLCDKPIFDRNVHGHIWPIDES